MPGKDHTKEQFTDAFEGVHPGPDFHHFHRLPARKGGKQAGKAQNMIEMPVGDQNAVQTAKAQPGAQDLALGPLAAVNKKSLILIADQLGRQTPVNGWCGG